MPAFAGRVARAKGTSAALFRDHPHSHHVRRCATSTQAQLTRVKRFIAAASSRESYVTARNRRRVASFRFRRGTTRHPRRFAPRSRTTPLVNPLLRPHRLAVHPRRADDRRMTANAG
jgi:hypothetical protein